MARFQSGHDDPGGDRLTTGEFGLITRDVARSTGAAQVLLALRDIENGSIGIVSAWSHNGDAANLPRPPSVGGLVARVIESGHAGLEPINASGLTYAIGAPIAGPDATIGALCAAFPGVPEGRPTLWVVEAYARFAALCMHDPGTLEGLLSAAQRDALTGCLSYGALRKELDREIQRAARHGRDVSCCFVDLDGFKLVNDQHGHLHGSRVLARVAAALQKGMRDGDTLGRYGGDEFVAVLPDTGEDAAGVVAERLREHIARAAPNGSSRAIDASVGVAQWRPGTSSEEMLAAADDALRSAKEAGGAVVVKAGDRSSAPELSVKTGGME